MSRLLPMPPASRDRRIIRCAEAMWTPEDLAYSSRRRPNGAYNNGPGDESNERVINGVALAVFAGVLMLFGYWLCRP